MEEFYQKTDGSGVNNRVHKGPLVEQVLTQIQPKSKEGGRQPPYHPVPPALTH